MARVLRSVRGHVYAYQVARLGDGRREQRYIGPATPAEVAAWQERRSARGGRERGAQEACYNAQGSPQNEAGIHLPPPSGDTTAAGNVEGRGYWRNGQAAGAFLAEIMAIYQQRTGHAPSLAYCAPGLGAELGSLGLLVREVRGLNERSVILAGGDDHATP